MAPVCKDGGWQQNEWDSLGGVSDTNETKSNRTF